MIFEGFTEGEMKECVAIARGEMELDLSSRLYSKLYGHFITEMPYGTAKARTGDPDVWIIDRLGEMFGDGAP